MAKDRITLGGVFGVILLGGVAVAPKHAIGQTYIGIDLFKLTSPYVTEVFDVSQYPSASNGGQVVGQINLGPNVAPFSLALLWHGSNGGLTDLTPTALPGFNSAVSLATDGTHQVGVGGQDSGPIGAGFGHALLWTGTADSVVDLHPTSLPQFINSAAYGVGHGQQVGVGTTANDLDHALLWSGTANSAVDLHPTRLSGFERSEALNTDGIQQVGDGYNPALGAFGHFHALLWTGTADSAIDLNPSSLGVVDSHAYGVGGGQQVGAGAGSLQDSELHALLWRGSADSVVDLNPTGYTSSVALGTDGMHQIGYGDKSNGGGGALLWSGSADSAVNLQALLPPGFIGSKADTIDAQGNIWGTAVDTDFNIHAVEWSPVPEPAGFLLGSIGLVLMIAVGCWKRAG